MFLSVDMPYIDGLMQVCSTFITNTMKILQPCTKPAICFVKEENSNQSTDVIIVQFSQSSMNSSMIFFLEHRYANKYMDDKSCMNDIWLNTFHASPIIYAVFDIDVTVAARSRPSENVGDSQKGIVIYANN